MHSTLSSPNLTASKVCDSSPFSFRICLAADSSNHEQVQCWFCGHTASTSWSRKTSFVCQQCGQYNGFTSDGDYNKVIPSQFSAELNPVNFSKARGTFSSHSDVLCPDCTRNQNTIVQKLSEYTPKNDRSDEEIKEYTRLLELEYGLCSSCYRKVNDKLRQKTLKDTWPSHVKLPCLQSTDSISYYSTPSHHSTNYTMDSLINSSGRSLEDELADTKLFSATKNYNNVFRPSVLSSSNISPSAIGSQHSTVNSRHSFRSSNMYSTHYNPMKQQMIESGQRDDDNLSYLSSVSHYKPNCYTLDSNSSGHLPTNLTQSMVKHKSNSSKRKRRTGLIHFVLCLLFGRLETWKDVCLELTCLANAIFLSIVIYCTYRLMYCLVNVFDN
ncbi:hypothetical protein Smp_159910 [Schistosoma mansoni]|uniref:hypothetical protein n=1 Tax=Schistosoma mansoni TaxID=6183 RepID=UPI0001A6223D|nr:hypothetical protein Smp_159910 [Schistosoma mansoni]|eukprot:XP_018645439.1 hypothetical protein Smp_159910 [Schistosoma mansoni]